MNKIFLNILKEIGIAIGMLVVILAAAFIAFKDQLPYDEEVREAEQYVRVDIKDYSVSSSDRISEVTAVTITHKAETEQIVEAENDVRIQTGKNTPFGSISGTSDLPTEKVGTTVSIQEGADTNNESSSNQCNDDLEYPVTDNMIDDIAKAESESAESAADRRFNNEQE